MKRAIAACVFGIALAASGAAVAQIAPVTVLSPEDVATYRAIFEAQNSGAVARATELSAKLSDPILMGYVLRDRYLSRHYHAKFDELVEWMKKYADLDGADRIYRLAMKKRPRHSHVGVPGPAGMPRLRGGTYDSDGVSGDATSLSPDAQRLMGRLRDLEKDGRPEAAEEVVRGLTPGGLYSQRDIDRLTAYVARAYFAEGKDADALRLGEQIADRDNAPQGHWTAGLAAYRLGRYRDAARHFEAILAGSDPGARRFAGAAFWGARSWMRAGTPERVMTLYARAATEKGTFYGMIAARLMGKEAGPTLQEPTVDPLTLAALIQNTAAHRAVALWQIGHRDEAESDLTRAYATLPETFDPAICALARHIGPATLELRAAESAARRGIYLTSLFPEPVYQPNGGYTVDKALVLGIARQESRLMPVAVSSAGARGVMQIMPDTAARVAGDPSLAGRGRSRLDDPGYNMKLAQDYLQDLLNRSNGSLVGLTAAYNAGLGNLSRWLAAHEGVNDPILFIESIPVPETRDYVKRVLVNVWMYRKRFNEPIDGLDEAAAGKWPIYSSWAEAPRPRCIDDARFAIAAARLRSGPHRYPHCFGHAHARRRCFRRHAGGARARGRTRGRRRARSCVTRRTPSSISFSSASTIPSIDVVISTGGTGLTGRDVTPEAFRSVFEKEIDGFSALFHRISFDKIGTSTIQSRACAGVAKGTYLFALPGSPGAVKDGWDGILKDQLDARHRPCNFVEIMPRLRER